MDETMNTPNADTRLEIHALLANRKVAVVFNDYTKLAAACRRFKFEFGKAIGVIWFIKKLGGKLREPYKTMYKRSIR